MLGAVGVGQRARRGLLAACGLAVLWVFAFVGSAGAAATGPTLSGDMGASFGLGTVSAGGDGASGVFTTLESNLRVSGGSEQLAYDIRLRFRGNQDLEGEKETFADGQLQTTRATIIWLPSPALAVKIGRTPGVGGDSKADLEPVRGPTGLSEFLGNFTGADDGSLDVVYSTGDMRFGLAVVSACQPECASGLSGRSSGDAGQDNQTVMPHADLSFGPLFVHARLAQASGKYPQGTTVATGTKLVAAQAVSTTGLGLSLSYTAAPLYVGLDFESERHGCISAAKDNRKCSAYGSTLAAVGIKAMDAFLQVATRTAGALDKSATAAPGDEVDSTANLVALGYRIAVGETGAVYPELLQGTTNDGQQGAKDVTRTALRLSALYKF